MGRFLLFILIFLLVFGGGVSGTRDVRFSVLTPAFAQGNTPAAAASDDEEDDDEDEEDEEDEEDAAESEKPAETAAVEVPGVGFVTADFGRGWYVSLWKILLTILVYLCWVFSTDWLSSDCQENKFGIARWVPIVYGSFMGTLLLFWLIPVFWVSFPLLLAGYITPLAIYIVKRNAVLSDGEKVLTREHLRYCLADSLSLVGVKMETKAKDVHTTGPPIVLGPFGGTKTENEQRRIAARAHAGFRDARQLLADGLAQEAEIIVMDFSQTGVAIKYQVDGAWHNAAPIEREKADPALQALKLLCGLKPEDRRNKQEGKFKATFEYKYTFPEDRLKIKQVQEEIERTPEDDLVKQKELQRALQVAKESKRTPEVRTKDVTPKFVSQGTQTGERVLVQFEVEKTVFKSPEQLGMRDKVQEAAVEQLAREKGIFLFAAPPAGGLRSSMTVMLGKTDRYCRDFISVEDGEHKYEDVENIPVDITQAKTPEEWITYLRKLFHKEPNVVLLRETPTAEILDTVTEELRDENRLFITSVRAKDAAEAILRMMMTKCHAERFVKNLHAVLAQRLARRLCDHCKEMYQPTPQLLKQLGFPEGKQVMLFRPPTPPPPEEEKKAEPCPECRGIGYRGRVAIFELAVIGEVTRKTLLTQPKLELVRAALKKDGNRSLMDEGLMLAVKGTTSLQELKRALE